MRQCDNKSRSPILFFPNLGKRNQKLNFFLKFLDRQIESYIWIHIPVLFFSFNEQAYEIFDAHYFHHIPPLYTVISTLQNI